VPSMLGGPRRLPAIRVGRAAALVALRLAGLTLSGCASLVGIEEWDPQGDAGESAAISTTSSMTSGATGSGAGSAGGGGSSSSSTGGGGSGGAPVLGTAIVLDGVDDYVEFAPTSSFTPATGFTWELWFRADVVPTADDGVGPVRVLFSAMDGQNCEDIFLGFGSLHSTADELTFTVDRDGDCQGQDLDPARIGGFASDTWYHVAAVADYPMNKTRLYVDGVLRDTRGQFGSPIARTLPINAGRWTNGTLDLGYFDGRIDELRVYSSPLSAATIAEHYNAGKGTYGDMLDPGIVSGWHFDEGANDTVFDFAAGANGTLNGGATWGTGHVPKP
jgi:hypothetical protein